jgi:predicted methyltransferase
MDRLWLLVAVVSLFGAGMMGAAPPPRQDRQAAYDRERAAYEAKRDATYREDKVLDIAGVKPAMVVGELGAGDGYFTMKLAPRVGPRGKVYANDILQGGLADLRLRAKQAGFSNIETILGTESDPRLPKGLLDMVFLVRTLHDLDRPAEMLETLAPSLKPGATMVIVELENEARDATDEAHSLTRRDFLDIFAKTQYTIERIDKSLPDPRSVVFILSRKKVPSRDYGTGRLEGAR